jgi:hypothetical protein
MYIDEENTNEPTERLGDLYDKKLTESKKYKIHSKNDKSIDEFIESNELNANDPLTATLLPPRKHVSFRTSKAIADIYISMYDYMQLKKGTKYSKQTFWDTVMYNGYSNLKNLGNPSFAIVQLYKELQNCSPRIKKKMPQMLDFNLESRAHVLNFQLTKEQEINVDTIINRYIFDISQHGDLPYLMIIFSFINSDYDKELRMLFAEHVEEYYNIMIEYINDIDRNIYNLNIGILEKVSSFSAKETYCVIEYCNKLVSFINERTDPNIKKQAELIIEFCKWIKENEDTYYKYYPKLETRLTGDSIDKLIKWADTYNIKNKEKTDSKDGKKEIESKEEVENKNSNIF